jgi:phosphate-selective porin OprO/OprP
MNFNKKLAVAVSGAVLLMAGQFALADSATDIVDALVSKGVLTEEEGKLITKGHTSKTKVAPVVKEKDGAFILESANEANSISLTGRMHLDYRASSIDETDLGSVRSDRDLASLADQFELRRARLGVKGKFAKDFKYEIVGNLPGTATVDIAYFDWAKYDAFQIRGGKFKQPFGLEELISSNNMTMMERSYLDQTVPGKKIGIQMMGAPAKGLTYALSTYQHNDNERDLYGDGEVSGAGRTTFNFAESMGDKERIMHIGLAGLNSTYSITGASSSQTSSDASATARATISSFRSAGRGLSNVFRAQVGTGNCNTAAAGCVSEYGAKVTQRALGLEGIFASGSFKVMGEYSRGQYKGESLGVNNPLSAAGNTAGSVEYDTATGYIETGYILTGEKYADSYKGGVFSSFKPKNNFDIDNNQWGLLELALRLEEYQVDDIKMSGNSNNRVQGSLSSYSASGSNTSTTGTGVKATGKTYTAGIRWILNPNLVVKANYAYTRLGDDYNPIDTVASTSLTPINSESIISTRLQYMF